MADLPFDRKTYGVREKPLSPDWNGGMAQQDRTLRDVMMYLLAGRTSDVSSARLPYSAFAGDSFRIAGSAIPAMSVVVNSGIGFQYNPSDPAVNIGSPDLQSVSDLSSFKPLYVDNPITFAVPAAPGAPNSRIDIIEVRANRNLVDSTSRLQLDPVARVFSPHSFFKTLTFDLDGQTGVVAAGGGDSIAALSYKTGTAANPGVAPATTAGYVKLCEIYVPNGLASVDGTAIRDFRPLAAPGGIVRASARFRILYNGGAPTCSILSMNAPPGVDMAVTPTGALLVGNRGDFALWVAAGGITKVSGVTCTVEKTSTGIASGTSLQVTPMADSAAGSTRALISSEVTILSGLGVKLAVGTPVYRLLMTNGLLVYRDGTGTASIVNANLEDLIFSVGVDLGYH